MNELMRINNWLVPELLAADRDFLVVYKPPKMHSVPLARSHKIPLSETILDWCIKKFPEVAELSGRREGEGGLLHRLDYETQGLLLFARTALGMENLLRQQKEGKILKEYSALASECKLNLPGFPVNSRIRSNPCIESAFRPFGPGRKTVRPLLPDTDQVYRTEILEKQMLAEDIAAFRLRLSRGYRHQIRCHLAWLGWPILNDALYGGLSFGKGLLCLRSSSISFNDPGSGEKCVFSIPLFTYDSL